MRDCEERLRDEEALLSDRVDRLAVFVTIEEFDHLPDDQKGILRVQLHCMRGYLNCLRERIRLVCPRVTVRTPRGDWEGVVSGDELVLELIDRVAKEKEVERLGEAIQLTAKRGGTWEVLDTGSRVLDCAPGVTVFELVAVGGAV